MTLGSASHQKPGKPGRNTVGAGETRVNLARDEARPACQQQEGLGHDLNFSNRLVRTRMPGGVAGARLTPPPMPINPQKIATAANGYYHCRAAWIFHFATEISVILCEAERQQKEGTKEDFKLLEKNLNELTNELNRYPPDPHGNHLAQGVTGAWTSSSVERLEAGVREKNHSKRARLKGLPLDWREQLFAGLGTDSKYRDVVAVLSATGARPAEYARGIEVSVVDSKSLRFRIWGAKTHDGKYGQEQRSFIVSADRKELVYLHQRVSSRGATLRVVAKAGALSDKIQQLSMKVFPTLHKTVSVYVFRHRFSADLKASTLSSCDLSAALGHSTDESKAYYSAARRALRGGGVRDVPSSRAVIERTAQRVGILLDSISQMQQRKRER